MLLAAPLLAVAVALAASGSQMELHLLANDIAQQHDAARGDHLRLTSGGHRKTQGGQPRNFLPAALFVTEPTSQNSRVFPRACLKTPQRRRPSRRRRAKSAAQRDFGVFWALQGQNHRVLALARRGADPHCRAAPTRAGRPEEARGVRRLRGLASVPSRCLAARAISSASRAASAA